MLGQAAGSGVSLVSKSDAFFVNAPGRPPSDMCLILSALLGHLAHDHLKAYEYYSRNRLHHGARSCEFQFVVSAPLFCTVCTVLVALLEFFYTFLV